MDFNHPLFIFMLSGFVFISILFNPVTIYYFLTAQYSQEYCIIYYFWKLSLIMAPLITFIFPKMCNDAIIMKQKFITLIYDILEASGWKPQNKNLIYHLLAIIMADALPEARIGFPFPDYALGWNKKIITKLFFCFLFILH